MDNNIIKDDSLLSSVSQISVKFQFKKYQGNSLFNPSIPLWNNKKPLKQEMEVSLDNIEQFNPMLGGRKILNYPQQQPTINRWINEDNKEQCQGVSQNQQDANIEQIITDKNKVILERQQVKVTKKKQIKHVVKRKRKKIKKLTEKSNGYIKNETKNIPKNFGKAIISFIEKHRNQLQPFCLSENILWQQFIFQLLEQKKLINTIADIRNLWINLKYSRLIRIFSNIFLRKYGFDYVFNSRISNVTVHLKYRRRLFDAILRPSQFQHIKQY